MTTHYERAPGIEAVALEQQEVLFSPKTNKFTLLNPNAKFVWQALAHSRSATQIAAALANGNPANGNLANGNAAGAGVELAVVQLLDAMTARGLVQPAAAAPAPAMDVPPASDGHAPALRDVTEEEVLASFQMSAAEISAAACWWFSCSTGCP